MENSFGEGNNNNHRSFELIRGDSFGFVDFKLYNNQGKRQTCMILNFVLLKRANVCMLGGSS